MPSQSFFYETTHSNFGMMFNDDYESIINTIQDIQVKAKALDESHNGIYRVISQFSSGGDGFQIFVAPYVRYVDLAEQILERFKATGYVYYKDKHEQNRQIRKKEFLSELKKIMSISGGIKKTEVAKTVTLIKDHFEKEALRLDQAVEAIAKDYNFGIVKHQEYYSGLADTWIEAIQPEKKVA